MAEKIKHVIISPPLELTLSDTEVRVLSLYTKQFELIGIRAEAQQQNSVLVHSAPLCFVERISTEVIFHEKLLFHEKLIFNEKL